MNKSLTILALCIAICTAASATADTVKLGTWGFSNITHNSAASAAVGEAQLFVDLFGVNSSRVEFLFRNTGPYGSSITDVYIDDGSDRSLIRIADIINSDGVSFSRGAAPPNLPGGNSLSPAFRGTRGLSADSDAPVRRNGVDPGEELGIVFRMASGKTWNDVVNDLLSQDLRIGIHVQGFKYGYSESFVNTTASNVPHSDNPTPSAFAALLGMGGLGALRVWRRRRKS